jgi:hypothetical protein
VRKVVKEIVNIEEMPKILIEARRDFVRVREEVR